MGAAAYNYIMKPAASGALIMKATVTELHQFTPLNEMTGAAQMEAKYVDWLVVQKENIFILLSLQVYKFAMNYLSQTNVDFRWDQECSNYSLRC